MELHFHYVERSPFGRPAANLSSGIDPVAWQDLDMAVNERDGCSIQSYSTSKRRSLLGTAALAGSVPAVRRLVAAGFPADADDNRSPLHMALQCKMCSEDVGVVIATLLLKAGAEPTQPDGGGQTPAHLARQRGWERVEALLSKRGTHQALHLSHAGEKHNDGKGKLLSLALGRKAGGAYVACGNPFIKPVAGGKKQTAQSNDGMVPSGAMLQLHVEVLSKLQTSRIDALLVTMPTERNASNLWRNYTQVGELARRLRYPLEVMEVGNNTLGSYGMFLHAFAVHRRRFSFYVMSEIDYVPLIHHFDAVLMELVASAFKGRPGFLTGMILGRPVESRSRYGLHPESSAVATTATLEQIFKCIYGASAQPWMRKAGPCVRDPAYCSVSDFMAYLVQTKGSKYRTSDHGDPATVKRYRMYHVQEGFGLLLRDARVPMIDWTNLYRVPYWNHREPVIDSTGGEHNGVPVDRVLFGPIQQLFRLQYMRNCRGLDRPCLVRDWRTHFDCCPPMTPSTAMRTRAQYSVRPDDAITRRRALQLDVAGPALQQASCTNIDGTRWHCAVQSESERYLCSSLPPPPRTPPSPTDVDIISQVGPT